MVEFNPDGSVKLPERFTKKKSEDNEKMRCSRCIRINREIVSFSAPKQCKLNITLSDTIIDNRFVENIYTYFSKDSPVPTSIEKIDEKNFSVTIGTNFRRCTACNSLINKYREFFDGSVIENKGSCTFEVRKFAYEDYFD